VTREETLAIMGVLKAAYPNYYRDMNRRDAEAVVELWASMFADDPAPVVAMAVKAHIASDTKGFPPHIGAIKAAIGKLTRPQELEMSEMEAWNQVRRAIAGASAADWSRRMQADGSMGKTSAERNFDALPEILQRLVGSPKQLAEWELLPDDEINTIIQSNFMRSFRARVSHEKELLALPADVRDSMQQLAAGKQMPQLNAAK
jgi:hypothetical protein